jgi:alanyl-tRNA synthetase
VPTDRLYYTDPYLRDFEADVAAVRRVGDRNGVVLDRTAFYPTSGGQPFDVGVLGGARVVDVVDDDDGEVVHVIEGDAPSGRVEGRIDWRRRFEHMQQHTGQHVLSAAFDRLLGVRTESFHLGAAAATIDLGREVSPSEIAQAEDAANAVVWEDRPVTIRFVDAVEAAALPLRKESARSGRLRIIEVADFDVSACGGTHVARTGAIGIIAVSAWERFKGASRIEFRCGGRALGGYRALRDLTTAGSRLLSTSADDLVPAIERLQTENRETKKRAKDLESRLAVYDAAALADRAVSVGGMRLAIDSLPDLDLSGLKPLAQSIAARPGHAASLLTRTAPISIVIARAPDVSLDASALLKSLIARFGGKGGGRPEMAQGGGFNASADEVMAGVRELLGG